LNHVTRRRRNTRLSIATQVWLASVAAISVPAVANAQAATANSSAAVDEVVVTAQRRSEKLQDVPVAISAFSSDQLAVAGVNDSKDLAQITPGLHYTQAGFSSQFTIRGIGARGVAPGDEAPVPIYIDGIYQPFIPAGNLSLNDIEQVEVLKGPQGTLYGRNATGGAISITTRRPEPGFSGSVEAGYGTFNQWSGSAYISGGGDKLAADLAVAAVRDDGYTRNVSTNKEVNQTGDVALRGKLVYDPSDKFEATAAISYTNDADSTGNAYHALNNNTIARRFVPGYMSPSSFYDIAENLNPYNKLHQLGGSLSLVYHADGFTLTSLTGVQDNSVKANVDQDYSSLDIGSQVYTQVSKNQYEEVYASSDLPGRLQWIAGLVYYHDISGVRPSVQKLEALSGIVTTTPLRNSLTTNSYAAYAQATYRITDQISITAGGRYTQELKGLDALVGVTSPTHIENSATFSNFTPNVIFQYNPFETLNLYAKASSGFKSGIFNGFGITVAQTQPVRPETATQFELGAKSHPLPWLTFNSAVYHTTDKNQQVNTRDPVTQTSVIQNVGEADIWGGEAELIARVDPLLNIRAGYSVVDGHYHNFPAAQDVSPTLVNGVPVGGNTTVFQNAEGDRIIRTPEFMWNVGFDRTIPLSFGELVASANLDYNGSEYWDALNLIQQKAYYLLTAKMQWWAPGHKFGVSVWGNNLLNVVYPMSIVTNGLGTAETVAEPRTVGVKLNYKW